MLRLTRLAVAMLAGSVVHGCAHAPLFVDGTWEHPRLAGVTCEATRETSSVRVGVKDQLGVALPGVLIYLLPKTAGSQPEVKVASSDSLGVATLEGSGVGVHVLVAVMPGFDPEVHTALLEKGCSGNVNFVLRVAVGPK